ncbi:hypothetical protein G4B88_015636 [Cannabis sativa]|uniref:Uncharacterized protein n=1 Tax=Cannabis sativa TaxID=3483 RepID=A0A7J6H631_CANSA|nr:hypothetical protein G4B88_015636 [Cannabis sativa]
MTESVEKSSTFMVRNRAWSSETTITDVNVDSLSQCATFLNLQEVSNMAMTCNLFKKVAYSDPIWHRLYREHWHREIPAAVSQKLGARDAYLARHKSVNQFEFSDPIGFDTFTASKPVDHLIIDNNTIIFAHGPWLRITNINTPFLTKGSTVMLNGHTERITCMRLFSANETPLFQRESQSDDDDEKFIVTSSKDRSIRVWWKGSCYKTFRGHSATVSALSDELLGDGVGNILASGGDDGTVRLWSLEAGVKSGQHALKATLCGHDKTVKLMSLANCVGMTSVPGLPVNMKCHETMLLIASAELDGHRGPVNLLHMDQYKVVTAGRKDAGVNVWEANTGIQTNSLLCEYGDQGENAAPNGCSALAVSKTRIVTASYGHGYGLMRFRDFYQAFSPMFEPNQRFD